MKENKAELNEELKVLSPYGENRGKVTVVDEDGFKHKTELSRKQWLTKDLKDYFLSGLGSLKFDDIRVARGIDFSKDSDGARDDREMDGARIATIISESPKPLEVKFQIDMKNDYFSVGTKDASLFMFGLSTQRKGQDNVGLSSANQLPGRAFLIPKTIDDDAKLPRRKGKSEEEVAEEVLEKPYVDKNGNIVIYHSDKNGAGKTYYIKETYFIKQAQAVRDLGVVSKNNQPSQFLVLPSGQITNEWDGKVAGVKDKDLEKSDKAIPAILGDRREDEETFNKNLLIASAAAFVYETEIGKSSPVRTKERKSNEPKFVKTKEPVENEKLPEYEEFKGVDGVYGCWKFKASIPISIVPKSKFDAYGQAVRIAKKADNPTKRDKFNDKIKEEIKAVNEWLEANDDADEKTRAKYKNKLAKLQDKLIEKSNMRIYAATNDENGKIDYFVYIGDDKEAPKTKDDLLDKDNVFKIRKTGLKVIDGRSTPVLEVYGNRHDESKGMVHDEILNIIDVTPGGNTELTELCETFSRAEKSIGMFNAFETMFYGHISKKHAEEADSKKNTFYTNEAKREKPTMPDTKGMSPEDKAKQKANYAAAKKRHNSKEEKRERARTKHVSSGFKAGELVKGFLKKATVFAIAAVGLVGALQAAGGISHGIGENQAERVAYKDTVGYVQSVSNVNNGDNGDNKDENQGEAVPLNGNYNSMTDSVEPTLFNYKLVNGNTVEIDTSRPSIIASLFMGENPTTFGYDMHGVREVEKKNWGARLLVSNLGGPDFTMGGIKGAYSALGEMVGQEVKENGVVMNDVVYPNGTTDMNSFVEALESLGMAEKEANVAAKSYTEAFSVAYEASKDMVSVEPEEEISYNLADGQLAETLGALINKDVTTIISVNYDNVNKEGSVHALTKDGNLIEISFNNGAGYSVEINNTSGVEAAILDAFDKAKVADEDADKTTSAEDYFEVNEYAPIAELNLGSKESKLNNYLSETYGENVGVYYSINPGMDDNGKVAYQTGFVIVGAEDLDITRLKTSVLSTTNQTTTDQKIIYCATHAFGCSLGPASGLYNGGVKVDTVTNELSEADKAVAEGVLISEYTMTTPSSERER